MIYAKPDGCRRRHIESLWIGDHSNAMPARPDFKAYRRVAALSDGNSWVVGLA